MTWVKPGELEGDPLEAARCQGKFAYKNSRVALKVVRDMQRARRGKRSQRKGMNVNKLCAYRCPYCNQFHIGSEK